MTQASAESSPTDWSEVDGLPGARRPPPAGRGRAYRTITEREPTSWLPGRENPKALSPVAESGESRLAGKPALGGATGRSILGFCVGHSGSLDRSELDTVSPGSQNSPRCTRAPRSLEGSARCRPAGTVVDGA